MLKGKKGLYVLLPLVLFIWGAIIYKVTDAFAPQKAAIIPANTQVQSAYKLAEREVFEIGTPSRDPFLGKTYTAPKIKTPPKKAKPKKKKLIWPRIKYKGIVSNSSATTKVFFVEINRGVQLLKIGAKANDVILKRGNDEEITLEFQGEHKEFKISK